MKNGYYFYKTEMGRSMKELVEYFEYFIYGLESRIKFRYQKLQGKGIRSLLNWFLNCSDQRFEEWLEGNFIDVDSEGLVFEMGGKLDMFGGVGGEVVFDEDDDESDDDEVLYRCIFILQCYCYYCFCFMDQSFWKCIVFFVFFVYLIV